MRIKSIIFLIFLTSLVTACIGSTGQAETIRGSGSVVTEERAVSGFTAVSLQGVGELVIDQTGSESLTITADDNLLPYIETRVSGGELIISVQDNVLFSSVSELTYQVTVETIDSLDLDGAGNVAVTNLDVDTWQVNLAGTGNITVSGQADKQTIEINGAGVYNADDLASRDVTVRHNGAGSTVVQASEQLDVHIDGLGTVEYIGDPVVTQTINGLGTVQQR